MYGSLRRITVLTAAIGMLVAALASCTGSKTSPPIPCGAPVAAPCPTEPPAQRRRAGRARVPSAELHRHPRQFSRRHFRFTNGLSASYRAMSPSATPPFSNPIYQESGSAGYILPAAYVGLGEALRELELPRAHDRRVYVKIIRYPRLHCDGDPDRFLNRDHRGGSFLEAFSSTITGPKRQISRPDVVPSRRRVFFGFSQLRCFLRRG